MLLRTAVIVCAGAVLLGVSVGASAGVRPPENRKDDPAAEKESGPGNGVPASPAVIATRGDLGRAYLELERAVAQRGDAAGDLLRGVNQRFDEATGEFFRGDFGGAVAILHEQTRRLIGPEKPSAAWLVGRSLRCEVEPPVLIAGTLDEVKVTLKRMYPTKAGEKPGVARVSLEDRGGFRRDAEVVLPGSDEQFEKVLSFRATHLNPGRARVTIRIDERVYDLGWLDVVQTSLDSQREENAKKLDAVPPVAGLAHAMQACRARNDLLTDVPTESDSTRMVIDVCELAKQVKKEIGELSRGKDPYRNVSGDRWTVFDAGGAVTPMRIFGTVLTLPPGVKSYGRPLVIAVHGLGGDENLFMEGYGAGLIEKLAAARGFVVASPRVSMLSSSPGVFDAIVEAAASEFDIDRSRVYLIGHSMGGGIVCAWAKLRPDKIAGVCSVAGVGTFAGTGKLPRTLVFGAELDPLIHSEVIAADAEAAKSQGLNVEFRLLKDQGHALAMGRALPQAVEWMLNGGMPSQQK